MPRQARLMRPKSQAALPDDEDEPYEIEDWMMGQPAEEKAQQ